jgi:hypothetical protein
VRLSPGQKAAAGQAKRRPVPSILTLSLTWPGQEAQQAGAAEGGAVTASWGSVARGRGDDRSWRAWLADGEDECFAGDGLVVIAAVLDGAVEGVAEEGTAAAGAVGDGAAEVDAGADGVGDDGAGTEPAPYR